MPTGSYKLKQITFITFLLILTALLFSPVTSQAEDLYVKVGDTIGNSGEKNSVISVFLSNWEDDVVAFTLWLQLDKPNILYFQTDTMTIVDTTHWVCTDWEGPVCTDSIAGNADTLYWRCIKYEKDHLGQDSCVDWILVSPDSPYTWMQLPDSPLIVHIDTLVAEIGNIDTVGSLIGGWDYVGTRSYSTDKHDVKVTAIANTIGGSTGRKIPAGQYNGLLFRLLGDINTIADDDTNRYVEIRIESHALQHFIFSRPDGSAIGIHTMEVPDSNLFRCVLWSGVPYESPCMAYDRVTKPPYDSVAYVMDTVAYLDTLEVVIDEGSLTVLAGLCGNCNNDPNDIIDISDITFMIAALYLGGPQPEIFRLCDMNCDDLMDISDITATISYLYLGGAELCSPERGCVKK
ncbi:MAG: hypothetical protein PHN52_11040 [candidate division Zixibacteria bacterium]|nr:hypothetical protein [candidate division Zixibacteria bacterium]